MTLPAGNYEWPFELAIPGSMVESIEGLTDAHIKYKLKAVVARGRLSHNFYAFKPVRIIRTLDPSALERTMSLRNLWANKVEYSIVVSQSAVVFGTSIQICGCPRLSEFVHDTKRFVLYNRPAIEQAPFQTYCQDPQCGHPLVIQY